MKWLTLFLLANTCLAAPVIDLGKSQVRAKMRGPSLEMIESGRLDAQTTSRAALSQLKGLEDWLTRPEPKPIEKKEESR